MNTSCLRIVIILLLTGSIYICKAMEFESNSGYESEITQILQYVINNNRLMLKSKKLVVQDKEYIEEKITSIEMLVKIASGIKYEFMKDIKRDTEGRIGFYSLNAIFEQMNELGMKFEQLTSEEKIEELLYNSHLLYLGKLSIIKYKTDKIQDMLKSSNEPQFRSQQRYDKNNNSCLVN